MRTIPVLLIFILFAACQKEVDNCSQYGWANISAARYMGKSVTGARGENGVFYDVSCTFNSSCYSLNKLIEAKDGDTIVIKAEYVFNTCTACAEVFSAQTKTYSFVPPDNGTYYIKWQGIPNRLDTVHLP